MSFPVKSTVLAMSLAATAAFAQPGSGPARGMPPCQAGVACAVQPGNKVMQRGPRMQAMTPEQRQARIEQRIAQQEKMLQITAAQRPQWNAFVNAHKTMGAARMTDAERQQAATMTPDQRMKWHAQQMEARAQQMNQMAGHVKALRDVLTPEQRALRRQKVTAFTQRYGEKEFIRAVLNVYERAMAEYKAKMKIKAKAKSKGVR